MDGCADDLLRAVGVCCSHRKCVCTWAASLGVWCDYCVSSNISIWLYTQLNSRTLQYEAVHLPDPVIIIGHLVKTDEWIQSLYVPFRLKRVQEELQLLMLLHIG